MKTFRTATINILNSKKKDETLKRYELCLEALRIYRPHFVFFQEVTFPEDLRKLLEEAGYNHFSGGSRKSGGGTTDHLVIASLSELQEVDGAIQGRHPGIICEAMGSIEGKKVHLMNAHLTWGATREADRLRLVSDIEKASRMREKEVDLTILGGDLNTVPEARSIRFLRGLDVDLNGDSTFWVDCGDEAREKSAHWTSDHGTNILGRETAKSKGVGQTKLLPKRRIDYIFVKGWVYGNAGSPLKVRHLRNPQGTIYTDHEPIMVDHLLTMGRSGKVHLDLITI